MLSIFFAFFFGIISFGYSQEERPFKNATDEYKYLGDYNYYSEQYKIAVENYQKINISEDLQGLSLMKRFAKSLKMVGRVAESDNLLNERIRLLAKLKNSTKQLVGIKDLEYWHSPSRIDDINSKYTEQSVSFIGTNKIMYVSNTNYNIVISDDKSDKYKYKNAYYDIFSTNVNRDASFVYQQPTQLTIKNRETGETKGLYNSPILTKDGKTIYFAMNRCREKRKKGQMKVNISIDCPLKLLKAELGEDDTFYFSEELPFNFDKASVFLPTLNEDENILYFFTNGLDTLHPGVGFVEINDDGTYGEVQKLQGFDDFQGSISTPFVHDKTLYFSSSKDGTFDIYQAKFTAIDSVEKIEKLPSLFNTDKFDEFGFVFNEKIGEGLFVTNRDGSDDIFQVALKNTTLYFEVKDYHTGEKISDFKALVKDMEGNVILDEIAKNGSFTVELSPAKDYEIRVYKKGYILSEIDLPGTGNYVDRLDIYNQSIDLFPIIENNETSPSLDEVLEQDSDSVVVVDENPKQEKIFKPIVESIYFDFDSYQLSKNEKKKIDEFLKRITVSNAKISVSGYADSRGDSVYNDHLSQKRAEEVYCYLISNINNKNIEKYYFGEKKNVNGCIDGVPCSKIEHSKNRRVQIKSSL